MSSRTVVVQNRSGRTEVEVRQVARRGSNGAGSFRTFEPASAPTPAVSEGPETGLFGEPSVQFQFPEDLEQAKAMRARVVAELQSLEAWLGGRDGGTARPNWQRHHSERAAKAYRAKQLGLQARGLRAHIAELNRVEFARRHGRLLVEFYQGVAELEESGADIGDRLRTAMQRFETGGRNG